MESFPPCNPEIHRYFGKIKGLGKLGERNAIAADKGHLELCRLFIEAGAWINPS